MYSKPHELGGPPIPYVSRKERGPCRPRQAHNDRRIWCRKAPETGGIAKTGCETSETHALLEKGLMKIKILKGTVRKRSIDDYMKAIENAKRHVSKNNGELPRKLRYDLYWAYKDMGNTLNARGDMETGAEFLLFAARTMKCDKTMLDAIELAKAAGNFGHAGALYVEYVKIAVREYRIYGFNDVLGEATATIRKLEPDQRAHIAGKIAEILDEHSYRTERFTRAAGFESYSLGVEEFVRPFRLMANGQV